MPVENTAVEMSKSFAALGLTIADLHATMKTLTDQMLKIRDAVPAVDQQYVIEEWL